MIRKKKAIKKEAVVEEKKDPIVHEKKSDVIVTRVCDKTGEVIRTFNGKKGAIVAKKWAEERGLKVK